MNEEQKIQIDANADGVGGVVPDICVSLTKESVYAMYVEGVDMVLEAAVTMLNGMQ